MVHHLTAESPRSVVCRFFCDGNIDGQRDATSLLQSLIFQIIDRRRRLVRLVRRASNSGGLQVLRQVDSLWALFVRLIRTAKIGEVDIIIDAIDECDDKTQSLFARRIAELIKLDSSTLIKFIITSRPNTPAAFALDAESSRLVKLSLEENQDIIGRDVNMVIHHRLEMLVRRGGCIPSAREYLERTLVSKADRTFLWITLVLQLLEQRRVLSTKKDVMKIVDHLPPDLSSVYQHLLLSIPEDDRALASRILRTVLASSRPLTVEEIGIILSLEPGTEPTSPDAEASLSIDDRNVQAALGPLIRVSQSKVELVHQSPKEYLIHLNSDSKNPLAAVFGFDIQRDTQSLVSACWRYLSLDEFQDDIFAAYDFEESTVPVTSPVSSATSQSSFNLYDEPMFKDRSILESDACGRIAARHKLFDYAAMYWALDFSRCESVSSPAQQRTAQGLCAKDQWRTSNWFRYFWLNSYRDPYPAAVDPLLIMAFLGLANSLRDLLHNSEANNNQSVSYAVYWAAREGHDGCIRVLLERPEVDPSASVVNNQTSLSAAAEHGHTLCVLLLLQDGRFDINAANSHGRTPLSLAAGNGHNDIVRALLLREDLSANQPDNSGATPLFWAIYTGSVSVMSQLLTNRLVHNNQRDKHGRNALSWAAQDGLEEVVELLLRFPEVEKGQKDFSGRNPLSYAAQHGHYGVAQLLVSGDIPSISECDNNGRNAISWAASQNKTDVLDFLLKTDHTAANMGDKSGWTPLFWALDPPGYPGNVSVFLASASVDINSRDRGHNRTVLSWASSYGDVETVSLLISVDGVDLEAKDDGGRTAFSYAAGCGSVKVATLLAEAGADILSKDHLGRTALWWAVSGGYLDTAQYVVSLSSALVTMIDVRTRTPLDLARQYQRHDIEALLLRQESLITR
ncbi:MAG: hypothetical protein LQ338_001610 [Usnochroma carphineum]|nr:MAG: hypothetical protein LQ338_001610 [Usnochroma carphineum]